MKKIKQLLALAIVIIAFSSCQKEGKKTVLTENYKGIFVINEGGFQKSNGSLGLYKPGSGEYFDVYQQVNETPLGDIVQSMAAINQFYYIVVNNSNKIEVVNQSDLRYKATINVNSPRQVFEISTTKAYISHLFSNEVSVLDLKSNTITKKININHSSDYFTIAKGKVFVGTNSNKVMVIDSKTDALLDSVVVGKGINKLFRTKDSTVVVFSTGEVDFGNGNVLENGKITILNDSNEILVSKTLSTGSYGGSITYNEFNQKYYFSLGGKIIYEYNLLTNSIVEWKTLDNNQSVYGLNADKSNGDLYVMDAKDYSSAGAIYILDLNKNLKKTIPVGIVPNSVFFNY